MVFWILVGSTCVCCHANTWPVEVEVTRWYGGEGSVDIGDKTEI